jgi:hypothetical protein
LLTLVFASLALVEYNQVNILKSQARSSQTETTSETLAFPRNESDIGQFCRFGQVVTHGSENQARNSTGQTITTFYKPVLVMQEPSTAYVCVTYQSLVTGPQSTNNSFFNKTFSFGFSLRVCHKFQSNESFGLQCSPSQALSGSAYPPQIILTNSTTTFTVIYNIASTVGSKRFYDDVGGLFWGCPLAVGYSASQLNSSDFHVNLGLTAGVYEPIEVTSVV